MAKRSIIGKKSIIQIMKNQPVGVETVIEEYSYVIRYNAETGSWCIYRCLAEDARYTWIKEGLEFVSPWKPWREMQ